MFCLSCAKARPRERLILSERRTLARLRLRYPDDSDADAVTARQLADLRTLFPRNMPTVDAIDCLIRAHKDFVHAKAYGSVDGHKPGRHPSQLKFAVKTANGYACDDCGAEWDHTVYPYAVTCDPCGKTLMTGLAAIKPEQWVRPYRELLLEMIDRAADALSDHDLRWGDKAADVPFESPDPNKLDETSGGVF